MCGAPDSGRHRPGLLGEGLSPAEVHVEYPQLVVDDVFACLRYAADLANERFVSVRQR